MIPSLQPSRPQTSLQHPPHLPFQQQIRNTQPEITTHLDRVSKPKSQIEAMPPAKTMPIMPVSPPTMQSYNPATTHPVFFSASFRKPPFQVPANAAFHPVATGYVFARDRVNSNTKL